MQCSFRLAEKKVNLTDLIVICCKSLLMTYMISVPLKPIRFKLISDYS